MKMQYTEEQIARANQTDLVSFLNAQGEQLVKSGREYRWKKHDRDPGIIGAAADCPHAMAEIICDGIHIHPSVIRNAFRMFGNDRMILISDAMRATGMEDGEYELGGQPVIKKGRLATLKDGTIAGSATNLFDCMKNAVQFGIPLGVAVKAATCNPAKSIECSQEIGTLAVGARADILLLDQDLNIVKIL